MTIGDWNCLSEESEATRNLSIIIQISPPASSPEGIVSLEMTLECGFVIILIMRSLLKSVIGNLRHEDEKSLYLSRFLPEVEMTFQS